MYMDGVVKFHTLDGTRCRWLVSFTLQIFYFPYPLDRRLVNYIRWQTEPSYTCQETKFVHRNRTQSTARPISCRKCILSRCFLTRETRDSGFRYISTSLTGSDIFICYVLAFYRLVLPILFCAVSDSICVELCLHSPTTPSWRGTQLKSAGTLPLLTYSLTYLLHGAEFYMKSWLSLGLSKNILLSLWNPKVHNRVHRSPPMDPTLSQLNPVRPIDPYLHKV
jgi:hypothetical protein